MSFRTRLSIAAILASLLFLTACAPSVTVRTDSDPTVDVTQYRTYNFFSQLGVEGENYSSLLGEHFRNAIHAEMEARGFSLSQDPEVFVNVTVGSEDKIRVNSYNEPYLYGGYYGYRGWGYYGSPWYGGGTRTTVHQYIEANVYIDLVDAAESKLVWQGVATFTLTDKMQQEMRQTVTTTVSSVFEQYPVAKPAD